MGGRNIVIPVMGACGAGKSTFVNTLLQEKIAKITHELSPSTNVPLNVPFSVPEQLGLQKNDTLWLVEAPGFDGTELRDLHVLEEIGKWMVKIHVEKSVLAGIIYLHDISQKRFDSTTQKNLDIFNSLCGESALRRIVLATTDWPENSEAPADSAIFVREKDLIDKHWDTMVKKGSRTSRFTGTHDSAQKIVKMALQGLESDGTGVLEIQKELVLEEKKILETKAGKRLNAYVARSANLEKDTKTVLKKIRVSFSRLFFFL